MKKELIVKHNKLIEANYKLTLQEQKLILILAKEIKKEDVCFKNCIFTVEELSNILSLDKRAYYSELKNLTEKLISRVIKIKEPDGLLQVSWLNSAKYYDKEGTIELSFSEKLKPYLLQLNSHFTKLEFNKIVSLNSVYAIRIYEFLKQYETLKERTVIINDLKETLQIQKKYKLYADFKRKVILKAQEEINEKTDLNIDFEEIKTGRKVTSIKFLISPNFKDVKIPKSKKLTAIQQSFEDLEIPKEEEMTESEKKYLNRANKIFSNPKK